MAKKISIFESAKTKTTTTSAKSDKTIVNVVGLEKPLLEFQFLKAQITDLEAQLSGVTDEIRTIGKEKFIELYKTNGTNPNTFLIRDGEGCVMVLPTDKYISIKDEDRANELMENYGDDVVMVDEKYYFNNEVLQRNMKSIEKLIKDAKTISDTDKENLLLRDVKYSVVKGFIDRLYEYKDNMESVVNDVQPIITLKNCGGKMAEGGALDSDFIANIYDDGGWVQVQETKIEYVKSYLQGMDEDGVRTTLEGVWGSSDDLDSWSKDKMINEAMKNENGEIDYVFVNFFGYAKGGGVGEKDKYIKLYNERIDKAVKDSIKETGEQAEDSWEWIEEEGGFTSEEIVGYYLDAYKEEALNTWMENVKHSKGHSTDKKVTEILKKLSGVEYANGGGVGVNKGDYDYGGSTMTDEATVRENLINGEIHCDILTKIIGCEPEYPHQIVGAIKLEKCFLRPYYKIA